VLREEAVGFFAAALSSVSEALFRSFAVLGEVVDFIEEVVLPCPFLLSLSFFVVLM
jgi:hypothetical protein